MVSRRRFLQAGAGAVAATSMACRGRPDPWTPEAAKKPANSPVAILGAPDYDETRLVEVVRQGLGICGISARNLRVVLKPNLVEFDPQGVINTHPTLVAAAIEAFRLEGAREVVVAEGSGHRRDSQYLLTASGLQEQLDDMGAHYVDLNHDRVRRTVLKSSFTDLGELYLPETVLDADLFVSMPKLKTHHWAGATLSMKNLFGIVPGAVYGWPKNPLHWAGIDGSIIDINAALSGRRFNIIDGIVGMEGNGPIQGVAKQVGVLVFGEDPVAVDATGARLMSIDPWKLRYLEATDAFLGNVGEDRIEARGESLSSFRANFDVVTAFEETKVEPSTGGAGGPARIDK